MPYLQSLILEAVAYDEGAHQLRARFRDSGKTVVYEEVPQEIYDLLIFADSVGRFFNEHIDGRYPVRRCVQENEPPAGRLYGTNAKKR